MSVDETTGPLSLGVMGRSLKENERRLALHPRHLDKIPDDLRSRVYLEHRYGEDFGFSEEQLAPWVAGFLSREEIVARCDVVLQPKPVLSDITELRVGQVLWGWPHCVQDEQLTQVAIDNRLTLIAFEAMNHWNRDGSFGLHVFHRNNELAGYCSVLHALGLAGMNGSYGRGLRAVVIGFGATARGAVGSLTALGVHEVDVLTHREVAAVAAAINSARLFHFEDADGAGRLSHVDTPDGFVPLASFLAQHDVIVNCVLQDTDDPHVFLTDADLAHLAPGTLVVDVSCDDPHVFLTEADLAHLAPGTLVVDVSCDEGMGFSWARPTSFEEPTFVVGDHVTYYAVDHSPSYLWDSATWEISSALLRFLRPVMEGSDAWDANQTIRRSIEIREGVVQNPAILSFQGRSPQHPHSPIAT